MRIGSNKGSEVEAYTDFIKEAEGLKSTLRTAWTAEGRQESTAEHSWRLALFAGVMCREFPELDREKVLMMCLVHDLGERYSGDISAALRPDAGDKLNQEREDVQRICGFLPKGEEGEVSGLWQSTNFSTRLDRSMLPESFLRLVMRNFSASSRLRLFTSTWAAIFSASRGFSMK